MTGLTPAQPRVLRLRHNTAPPPNGCRWCGYPLRESPDYPDGHPQRWVPGHGWHGWTEPTRAQIAARLRAKLTARR
ncbi:hypothetical protein ABZ671_01615 [Micromonospora sp. NPDC006766]|uniref:hypothetical protein n=1 Tax=Micromonospora sp. NPDC006766 TaxID=3154778 RepID=UPI0033C24C4F